jgi:hypothetical protein
MCIHIHTCTQHSKERAKIGQDHIWSVIGLPDGTFLWLQVRCIEHEHVCVCVCIYICILYMCVCVCVLQSYISKFSLKQWMGYALQQKQSVLTYEQLLTRCVLQCIYTCVNICVCIYTVYAQSFIY